MTLVSRCNDRLDFGLARVYFTAVRLHPPSEPFLEMRPLLNLTFRRRTGIQILCLALLTASVPAGAMHKGQPVASPMASGGCIGAPCNIGTDVVVVAVAVGAVIGVGAYFLLRKGPSITGCAVAGAGGLRLRDETDQREYTLSGNTSGVVAGDRVRAYGKKRGKDNPEFIVKKSPRDFGACKALPATP